MENCKKNQFKTRHGGNMSNHERIHEIELMLDILDKRISKLSNRAIDNTSNWTVIERVIKSLENKRKELEKEIDRLERSII